MILSNPWSNLSVHTYALRKKASSWMNKELNGWDGVRINAINKISNNFNIHTMVIFISHLSFKISVKH